MDHLHNKAQSPATTAEAMDTLCSSNNSSLAQLVPVALQPLGQTLNPVAKGALAMAHSMTRHKEYLQLQVGELFVRRCLLACLLACAILVQ